MKTHNGMRPRDIVVLLKIILQENSSWQYRDLSVELNISLSEISQSLKRSEMAGLYHPAHKKVARQSLFEFLCFGLSYVFPAQPGAIVRGIRTARSHPYFQGKVISNDEYVWPYEKGEVRGQSVLPLYPGCPVASLKDEVLYKALACIDILRIGGRREINMAVAELGKMLL